MGWQYSQRALVHSNLNYTTSLIEVQIISDVTSHAIPICHEHQTRPNWLQLVLTNLSCWCKAH